MSRDEKYQSISDAHREISSIARQMRDMASDVSYLHPKMADDLEHLSDALSRANKSIQNDHSEIISEELQESQAFMGNILSSLVQRTTGDTQ